MAIPFDIVPTTAAANDTFTLAAGESATLTLYRIDGSGLLPGMLGLIQREVTAGVWQTYDALSNTRDSMIFDGTGSWRLFKPASAVAYGAKGN